MLKIRRANYKDLDAIRQLFYDTITTVNAADYTAGQIKAWASGYQNSDHWIKKIDGQHFLVTEHEGKITGFGSITNDGYLDCLYVHKDHQRRGIAKAILKELEDYACRINLAEIWSDVSITARKFFEANGFIVSKVYNKIFRGVAFRNAIMKKRLA
jgi:putative acetyltransferase